MDQEGEVEFAIAIKIQGRVVVRLVGESGFATVLGVNFEDPEVEGACPSGWRFGLGLEEFDHAAFSRVHQDEVICAAASHGGDEEVGSSGVFEFAVKGGDGF